MHRLGAKLALAVVLLGATLVSAQPFRSGPGLTVISGGGGSGVTDVTCTNQFLRSIVGNLGTCASVANADLAGSIAASKLVGTDIATVGTITTGTWNAGGVTTSAGTDVNSGRHVQAGATGGIYWTGRAQMYSPSTTSLQLVDSSGSTSVSVGLGAVIDTTPPVGTVGSGTGVTVNATAGFRRVLNKVTATYAAWSAAATTADKTIYTLAAKQRLVGIIADVTATFTGGAVSDADMTCGKTAGGNEYLVSFDVDTATGTYGDADAELGTSINRANAIQGGDLPSWSATTALTCRLTTVGANTDALTTGSITFYIITEMM